MQRRQSQQNRLFELCSMQLYPILGYSKYLLFHFLAYLYPIEPY